MLLLVMLLYILVEEVFLLLWPPLQEKVIDSCLIFSCIVVIETLIRMLCLKCTTTILRLLTISHTLWKD